MKSSPSDIQHFLDTLADTPRRLATASTDVDDSRLHFRPSPGSWSALEILAHLRACADVWGASIESMRAAEEPSLPDIHPRKWLKQTNYTALLFSESFQAFAIQREMLLSILRSLSAEEWSRGAQIGTRRHTIFSQTRRMALHELAHCDQTEDLLKTGRT